MFEYDQYASMAGCQGSAGQQMNPNNGRNGFGFLSALLGSCGAQGYVSAYTDKEGWCFYADIPAPKDKLCQFYQPSTEEIWAGYARDFHPEFNISELKWRLTGIGRETQ